ncbi:CPK2 [Symbiodinium natans]|uniref:CPK2 protein n=1 Tax=Symbiodinium natans TaxID=878477 RepID=A0A812HRQ0_9DINO|nr:CPK2 [Symbiodinium natans]
MTEGRYRHLKQECEVFLTVDHPNIAQLSDVYEWEDGIAIIMEYCSGGELLHRLEAQAVYDEADAAEATSQMLQAVNYLHAHSIVHRDLKLQNFLYESPQKDALLKLIDFGLCETLEDADMKMKASVGTLEFCSPDVISGKEYTSQCDLWSLGVVVFMLLTGRPPWSTSRGFEGMRKDISKGLVKWDRLQNVSEHATDFVQQLLVVDPEQRMTAERALQHPWLTKTDVVRKPKLGRSVLVSLQQYSSKSKMQRLLLQLLAQELQPEEVSEMRELFMKLDSDARGTIRLCDLKDAMCRHTRRAPHNSPTISRWAQHLLSPKSRAAHRHRLRQATAPFLGAPADEAEQIFSMLDANGDEEVYYSDFLAATASVRWQLRREVMRKIFNRFDRDRSGAISMEEVRLVLEESLEDGSVEEMLQESKVVLDSNGEISFEAFVNLFEKKDVLPASEHHAVGDMMTCSIPRPHALPREDLLRAWAWDDTPKHLELGQKRVEQRVVGMFARPSRSSEWFVHAALEMSGTLEDDGLPSTADVSCRVPVVMALAVLGSALVLPGILSSSRWRQVEPSHVCGHASLQDLEQLGLPNVTAVNWGQWHGPYALPPERLILCASGAAFLWLQGDTNPLPLNHTLVSSLFLSLPRMWPQERLEQHGSFIWILDRDYNLIIAPTMQELPGKGLREVKHGDLCPGKNFFGENHVSGPYRGIARLGGEFNLAGNGNGSEWVMHAKSGYTAYRVSPETAAEYYHAQREAGRNESDIARNFQRCVFRQIFRAKEPLMRLLCFLHTKLSVDASLGDVRRCDIRSVASGGLPDLQSCTLKPSDALGCSMRKADPASVAVVHLIDWYAPGQDRCNLTTEDFGADLQRVGEDVLRHGQRSPADLAPHAPHGADVRKVQKRIKGLRKHSCLFSPEFTSRLGCNVHGCFGEGFTRKLKAVEQRLADDPLEASRLWEVAAQAWSQCQL